MSDANVVTHNPSESTVLTARGSDDVVLITLNRPEARNAVNASLAQELVDAINGAQTARCIVITGADPAFCAGLDLRNLGADRLSELPAFIPTIAASAVPTIAAVNGAAVTGGLEIALACDFVVASDAARFADTHLRVGVYPGPVLVDLPLRVGMAKAREMSLTGNFVDAEQALRIGLANHVVPHVELVPTALALASAIAESDPAMVATMRRDWDATWASPLSDAHALHRQIATDAGYASASSATLNANMAAVVDRSHQPSKT